MSIPTHSNLISAEELASEGLDKLSRKNRLIVDCRFSLATPDKGWAEYMDGHIPGAYYAHLDNDLSGPLTASSGRHPLPELSRWTYLLNRWGVDHDTQVVVYDHETGAIAARLWWMLRWSGHFNVALLDGGYQAWQEAGLPISVQIPEFVDTNTSIDLKVDSSLWISTHQLELELELPKSVLVDARSAERFHGITEPIDPVAGRIPGAVNMPLEENLSKDGRFLSADDLRSRFTKNIEGCKAKNNQSEVIHMCGSGVTACHNILAMEIAGLTGSRLYVGSWSEWIRDPDRPIVHDRQI